MITGLIVFFNFYYCLVIFSCWLADTLRALRGVYLSLHRVDILFWLYLCCLLKSSQLSETQHQRLAGGGWAAVIMEWVPGSSSKNFYEVDSLCLRFYPCLPGWSLDRSFCEVHLILRADKICFLKSPCEPFWENNLRLGIDGTGSFPKGRCGIGSGLCSFCSPISFLSR